MVPSDANTARPANVFWHIVEESLEEAEFLWTRWERFLDAPDLSVEKVFFWVEERLQGALDGLRAAGDSASDSLLEPALASDARGAVSAVAHVLATSSSPRAFELLARAMTGFDGTSLAAVRRGIEVADVPPLLAKLSYAVRDGLPASQAALLDIYTFRALDPESLVLALLESADSSVRAAALRASRYAKLVADVQIVHALRDSDIGVVIAAVETGLTRKLPEAWDACLHLFAEAKPATESRTLLPLLAMSGAPRAERLLLQAVENKDLTRDAVFALGVSGRAEAAEACIELMRQGRALKIAADSFCAITGLDLAAAGLVVKETAPEPPATLEDDDLAADLVPTIDDALPLPNVDGVVGWWQQRKAYFAKDSRYLRGQFFGLASLQQTLVSGPLRWRHEQARELAIRSGGAFHVPTRAFAREQRQQLSRMGALTSQQLNRIHGWAPLL